MKKDGILEERIKELEAELNNKDKELKKTKEKKNYFKELVEENNEPIYETTLDGKIKYCNPAFLEFFGFDKESVQEVNAKDLYVNPNRRQRFMDEVKKEGHLKDFEVYLKKGDGSTFLALVHTKAVKKHGKIAGYKGFISKSDSIVDELTGLFNRRYLSRKELEYRKIAKDVYKKGGEYPLSMMLIDIDDFKGYNDKHGHYQGNSALMSVAKVLKQISDDKYIAGRWGKGSDEFEIILPNVSEEKAKGIAEKVRGAIGEMIIPQSDAAKPKKGYEHITVSMGVGTYNPAIEYSWNIVIRGIDNALHCAKKIGKNRVMHTSDVENQ